MNKSKHQQSVRTDATNGESDKRNTSSFGKRKLLRLAWVLALFLSIAGWITLALFSDKTTWIDSDGFLHEPLFGLIPLSYFFLLVGLVLAVFDMALKLRKRR